MTIKKTNSFNWLLFILIIPVLCYIRCSKKEKGDNNVKGTVVWSVDGTNYTGQNGAYAMIVPGGTTTKIYGVTTGFSNIQIDMIYCNAPGVWIAKFPPPSTNAAFVLLETSGGIYESAYNSGSNQLTINVVQVSSTHIKGSFGGKLTNSSGTTVNLTGNFDVDF